MAPRGHRTEFVSTVTVDTGGEPVPPFLAGVFIDGCVSTNREEERLGSANKKEEKNKQKTNKKTKKKER
jgi:hypothetical protein